MNRPTPAIVTQHAARRLPRWVLLLLGLAYVLPGLFGRQPWRNADLSAFGVMLDMVNGSGNWLHPQVLGRTAEVKAWLPYWLGASAIELLPFIPADQAVRVPFALLLGLALLCTWYAMYHLARLPAAQPVAFAFGGEARPVDYARAMADTALLALVASLGLAQLSHETTADSAQLACCALMLYACARLASPHAERRWLSALVWWLGAVGLALSGAPWLGLTLASGWLIWSVASGTVNTLGTQRWQVWAFCVTGTVLTAALAWKLELPRRLEVWAHWSAWLEWDSWHDFGQLLAWFTWPAGPLALWTVWRWRRSLDSAHVLLPLWFVLAGVTSSWLLDNERALLMALPGLACLAAFALPTLKRSVTALVDWFALLFFSGCAFIIWFYWLAVHTGLSAKAAANVFRLVPGFLPTFTWWHVVPALLGTLLWLVVIIWRVGHNKPALWKSLVLSSAGSTLCWLLLMTLWLPALNFGMGLEPISRRVAAVVPNGACTAVYGLTQAQITALQYHGQLSLQRLRKSRPTTCDLLVVAPGSMASLQERIDLSQWSLLTKAPRLRENRDGLLVFQRRRPAAS